MNMATKADLEKKVAELEAQLEEALSASADERVEALSQENAELQGTVVELNKRLASLEKNAGQDLPVITIEDQDYQFKAPAFLFGDEKIQTADVVKNPNAYEEFLARAVERDEKGNLKFGIVTEFSNPE